MRTVLWGLFENSAVGIENRVLWGLFENSAVGIENRVLWGLFEVPWGDIFLIKT